MNFAFISGCIEGPEGPCVFGGKLDLACGYTCVSITNMNKVKQTLTNKKKPETRKEKKALYASPLREEQARLTEEKIQTALFELFQQNGSPESITYKGVAQAAGVTEMTVYRYYPDRSKLLQSLWSRINHLLGKNIRMPESVGSLLELNPKLHLGFDEHQAIMVASITSPQGREMRSSLNDIRRKAFLNIVSEINPDLDAAAKTRLAAVLQLLHSAYAWDSIKQQWGLSGAEIAQATQDALQVLINNAKKVRSI